MGERPIAIDWASASVEDARVSVPLTDKHSRAWGEAFERVLERLDKHGSGWGEIELDKRELHVADVRPGAEQDLRHLLESVVLQANAAVGADDAEPEEEERSGPDAEMTATFRSFAAR